MKLENPISWADQTINAVTGCDKVSAGCKNCYAEIGTRARVLRAGNPENGIVGIETWGPQGVRHPVNFEPVFRRLNKLCVCDKCHAGSEYSKLLLGKRCGCGGELRRIRLFADSNSDWLDSKWPVETLARFLDAIRTAPNVDVLLLTKRIGLWRERMELAWDNFQSRPIDDQSAAVWLGKWLDGVEAPANLWIGVSVENQKAADERIPLLLQIPAAVRFLSVEPLLENVRFDDEWLSCKVGTNGGIHWVIVGGESGKNRRDCGVSAIESVADQCLAAGVPCYVKQDCAFKSGQRGRISDICWSLKQFPKE